MKHDERPLADPRTIRAVLTLLFVSSACGVFYLSLVPLRYTPLGWSDTIERFRNIPWLALGIDKRADWAANGIIMIPVTLFAAGAIDWKRKSRMRLTVAGPFIVLFVCSLAVAIEFVQIWFPPRVVSLNDMSAGMLGGVAGLICWSAFGDAIGDKIRRFVIGKPGFDRIAILSDVGLWCLLIYSFMPLDLVFSYQELSEKWEAGRITLVPFSDLQGGLAGNLKMLIFVGRLMPFAVVARMRWPTQKAMRFILSWCILTELVQLPIYSRNFSTTSIVLTGLLSLVAIWITPRLVTYMNVFDSAKAWLIGAVAWTVVVLFGFLGRFKQLVRDPDLIIERLDSILAVPFARAQRSTEMQAGENILLKVAVFALLAFLLTGWRDRRSTKRKRLGTFVAFAWVLLVGASIEFGQVFLIPLVPDITDWIIYSVGALVGWWAFHLLIPRIADRTTDHDRHEERFG